MHMPLLFEPKSTHFNLAFIDDALCKKIVLNASIKHNVLVIGEEYFLIGYDCDSLEHLGCEQYTKQVNCQIIIYDASLEKEFLERKGYGNGKIGRFIFMKEWIDEEDGLTTRALLTVELFLEREFFDSIYENLKSKNKISSIKFEVENIEFGVGPIREWNLVESKEKYKEYTTSVYDATIIFDVY